MGIRGVRWEDACIALGGGTRPGWHDDFSKNLPVKENVTPLVFCICAICAMWNI
jgi:hypothetical protein